METTVDNLGAMCREFARILNVTDVDPDASLADLGADSMMVVELALVAQELYGKVIDLETVPIDGTMTLRNFEQQVQAL